MEPGLRLGVLLRCLMRVIWIAVLQRTMQSTKTQHSGMPWSMDFWKWASRECCGIKVSMIFTICRILKGNDNIVVAFIVYAKDFNLIKIMQSKAHTIFHYIPLICSRWRQCPAQSRQLQLQLSCYDRFLAPSLGHQFLHSHWFPLWICSALNQ